jgi:ribosomal protein S18 acetylase RimI-like enzyme
LLNCWFSVVVQLSFQSLPFSFDVTMKRPADQAKLLLFALLRSTATALATTGEKARIVLPQTQNIQLRLATRTDVSSIQSCNLACLPENYNSQFYCSHLRQWPDLALVAEDVSGHTDDKGRMGVSDQDRRLFNFGPNRGHSQPKIVAYVLGKIESRPIVDYDDPISGAHRVETLGHVTSLAVHHDFRRLGLATSLMEQLHHHLQSHGVQSCGLHVRTSNQAACRLYQEDGYEIAKIIPLYYQDGEDAYFMRKMIPCAQGPLWLPRKHFLSTSKLEASEDSSSESSSGSSSSELMTGTMN